MATKGEIVPAKTQTVNLAPVSEPVSPCSNYLKSREPKQQEQRDMDKPEQSTNF